MHGTTDTDTTAGLLAIYLNDHVAGSVGGVELLRRMSRAQRDSGRGPELDRLLSEVRADAATLRQVMAVLGVKALRYKPAVAWVGEKVSRVKPNGRHLRRSPLSDVIELETMGLGVTAKAALWAALRAVADRDERLDPDQLDLLIERAKRQAGTLEQMRLQAVAAAFSGR